MEGRVISLNLNLLMEKYDNIYQKNKNEYEITSYSKEIKVGLKKLIGNITVDVPWIMLVTNIFLLNLVEKKNMIFY